MSLLRRVNISARVISPLASSSSSTPTPIPSLRSTSAFSTSSPSHESKARRKARLTRKSHIEKKSSLLRAQTLSQPDTVLGYSRGNSHVWEESLLKQTLLEREKVWGQTTEASPAAGRGSGVEGALSTGLEGLSLAEDATGDRQRLPYTPQHFNFGLSPEIALSLLKDLPPLAAERDFLSSKILTDGVSTEKHALAEDKEFDKRDKLLRMMDLSNANSKGIAVENTRRIVETFGRKPNDTGSPEVQAAIMTARIHSLTSHLKIQPRDVHNRRPLRSLIHQRAKVLKYLRTLDVGRYDDCLKKIGVEPRAVEGEVIVSKKDLRGIIRGV